MLETTIAQTMTGPSAPETGAPREAADSFSIETRFGVLSFTADNRIHMPSGPLGFGDSRRFVLGALPPPANPRFKILQSEEDNDLSFIVTPLQPEDGCIELADLEDAAMSASISWDDAAFLLIVTVRPNDDGSADITVNLRAPLVVDVKEGLARQIVMVNANYPIQQPL